jgi:hypothetical protein
MMSDTATRIAKLSARGVALGYDLSALQGMPIDIRGLAHCSVGQDPQWVQTVGTITYSYTSLIAVSTEPVKWRPSSHLFVPTIWENGVRKFDGYCPEPALSQVPVIAE